MAITVTLMTSQSNYHAKDHHRANHLATKDHHLRAATKPKQTPMLTYSMDNETIRLLQLMSNEKGIRDVTVLTSIAYLRFHAVLFHHSLDGDTISHMDTTSPDYVESVETVASFLVHSNTTYEQQLACIRTLLDLSTLTKEGNDETINKLCGPILLFLTEKSVLQCPDLSKYQRIPLFREVREHCIRLLDLYHHHPAAKLITNIRNMKQVNKKREQKQQQQHQNKLSKLFKSSAKIMGERINTTTQVVTSSLDAAGDFIVNKTTEVAIELVTTLADVHNSTDNTLSNFNIRDALLQKFQSKERTSKSREEMVLKLQKYFDENNHTNCGFDATTTPLPVAGNKQMPTPISKDECRLNMERKFLEIIDYTSSDSCIDMEGPLHIIEVKPILNFNFRMGLKL